MLFALVATAPGSATTDDSPLNIIVGETNAATTDAEQVVERLGGVVRDNIELIGGFTATIPASSLEALANDSSVRWASLDRSVELLSWADETPDGRLPGSLDVVTNQVIRAGDFWRAGYTGAGVDVALIDSGIVPVDGLTTPGKVVNGPDLSLEQADEVRYLDTYGHGTHMAGIIAGRSDGATIEDARTTCCYLLGADGSLNRYDPSDPTGALETIAGTAANLRAMAVQPGTDVLFASTGSSLVTVDPTSGSVTTIGSFGSASGSVGTIGLNAVVVLTFDGDRLFGVQDMGSGDQDVIFEVNPVTGKAITGGFSGNDYVEIQKPSATLKSIADLAVDPTTGTMYGLAWDGTGRYEVATVNVATGAVALLGGDLKAKVDTIAFDGYGELWGFDREASELVVLDKSTGKGTSGSRPVAISTAVRDIAPTTANVLDTSASPHFLGVAPDARLVNVKVGAHDGSVDVSQVIAAIDWVVQHKNDNGLDIRVLNLSFGTDGVQKYEEDPLSFAVEQAWKHGIVVVVSVGNDGNGAKVRNPAFNPYVISVGSVDTAGTYGLGDDVLSTFSNCGDKSRRPDLVAPGKSVVSLRSPGSLSDELYPEARTGTRLFRGTGTSQSAAVVSGAAALLIDQRPELTPDQVKSILTTSARKNDQIDKNCQGAGLVDLSGALVTPTPSVSQSFKTSKGQGSLDAARGTHRIAIDGQAISGEVDIHGKPWNGTSWSGTSWSGTSWSGGVWNGTSWSGTSWSGTSWSGLSWSGTSWSGLSWTGTSWSGTSWSGTSWSGTSWSGTSWSGTSWSGTSWSGTSWSDASWAGVRWD